MDCGGASICAHRRQRSQCKDCTRRQAELAAADAKRGMHARLPQGTWRQRARGASLVICGLCPLCM